MGICECCKKFKDQISQQYLTMNYTLCLMCTGIIISGEIRNMKTVKLLIS